MDLMPTNSPLEQATPRTLDELFNADPLTISDAELVQLASALREARVNWAAEDQAAKTAGRRAKTSAAKLPVGSLSLGSLDIKL